MKIIVVLSTHAVHYSNIGNCRENVIQYLDMKASSSVKVRLWIKICFIREFRSFGIWNPTYL